MAVRVCRLEDIVPDTGVCALVGGEQVAVFRLADGSVHAVGNRDPFSSANVLSRGIVGDLKGELVVASPVYKQHFSLATGRCQEDASVRIPVFAVRVEEGHVVVEPRQQVRTTCPYCGVGCGVVAVVANGAIAEVRGDRTHPANFGRLCTKGAALERSLNAGARLLHPEVRGERASWDAALGHAAERFAETIARHGPDSVAFYNSGQLLTEDYYVFNKLARGLVGTNNVDTNSRLCMSSAVAGYKLSLGADAPPCAYEDIDAADLVFIAGSNTAFAHPVLYRRIEDARARNPALKLVVVDPRATVTARAADLHLALRPGSDVALFNAMLHVIVREDLLDAGYLAAHTENFDGLRELLAHWTPERAAQECDLAVADIERAARLFAESKAALSLYCQGLNQSVNGTFKNSALINLHLATGQIGRPGAGPFSLTGQPNAMGGREVGGMANLLSAHRDLASPQDRAEVAALWGVGSVPATPGKTAVEMFEAIGRGEIKAAWIACTNPAQSMPDALAVRRALAGAEFVVVQEAFRDAETCDYAHVLLPAATWGEKEGTVTNSERRISRVRAAVPPPGEARADWQIAADFARRLQQRLRKEVFFGYASAEEVFREHRESTRGRDLDITGLSYAVLERDGPQQWPYPEGARTGRTRLYADGVFPTPSGRARFVATEYVPPAEAPDAAYPLRLTTGRLRDQWHSMTRTGLDARLFSHSPEAEVNVHPRTLLDLGIVDGSLVRVTSRRGGMTMRVRASEDLRPGDAFVAMHWGGRFTGSAGTNVLTVGAIDPHSKQPELKHAAVRLRAFAPKWRAVLGAAGDAGALQRNLSQWLARFDYASLTLAEAGEGAVLGLELASAGEPDLAALASIDALLGLDGGTLLHRDPKRGIEKRVRIQGGMLTAFRLTGDLASAGHFRQAMLAHSEVTDEGLLLEQPVPTATGRAVCACYGVREAEIRAAVAAGADLARLQKELRCGTSCGSCLPELRRLAA
jgi:assimilatory nitrate reductase catalytic subunit